MSGWVKRMCDHCGKPARHRILHQSLPVWLGDYDGVPETTHLQEPRKLADFCERCAVVAEVNLLTGQWRVEMPEMVT